MNKLSTVILGVFVFLGGLTIGHAIYPDPEENFGAIYWLFNGLRAFRTGINSSGQLVTTENTNLGDSVLTIDDNDGSIKLRARTSIQLQALTPSASGEMLLNITIPTLCVSSGTTAGAWVYLGTTTVANAPQRACL